MYAKAMTFSDMGCGQGWGKVIEGAVEFYNEQWVRAFLMGRMLSALKVKVRVRFNKKCLRVVLSASAVLGRI